MPAGKQSLQSYIPSVFTTQSAVAYKANLDSNSSIVGNPAGMFYVYPTSPASLLVNIDVGFTYMQQGTGLFLNNGGAPTTVALVAPGSNSYYGTIYYDSSAATFGVVYSATGVSPAPILPEIIYQIPLAVVLLTSTTTQIQATNITDVRMVAFTPFGRTPSLSANTNYNVVGANRVDIALTMTAALTLTLTNLQMGVPVYVRAFNSTGGTLVLKIAATSPAGTAYVLLNDASGANLTATGWGVTTMATKDFGLSNPPATGAYLLSGFII
jgi:hypothetical protein